MPRDLRTLRGQGRKKGNTCPPNRRIPGHSLHSLIGQRRQRGKRCDPTINEFNRVKRSLKRKERREARQDRRADRELDRLLDLVQDDDPTLSNQDLKDLGLEDMIKVRHEKPSERLGGMNDDEVRDIIDSDFFSESSEEEEKVDDRSEKQSLLDSIIKVAVENQHLYKAKDVARIFNIGGLISNLGVLIKRLRKPSFINNVSLRELKKAMSDLRLFINSKKPQVPLGDDIKDMTFIENNFNRLSVAKLTEIKDNVRIIEYDSADRQDIKDRLMFDDGAVDICNRAISDSFINRTLNNDDMDGLIAYYNNIAVGFVFYDYKEDNRGEYVEVKLLCVKRPPAKLKGIPFGKIIMAMVEKIIKDVNEEVGRIFLEAVQEAVPFYQSIGFTILNEGGLVDMEKIINPAKVKDVAVIRGDDLDIDVDDLDLDFTAEEKAEQKALREKVKAFMRNKNN